MSPKSPSVDHLEQACRLDERGRREQEGRDARLAGSVTRLDRTADAVLSEFDECLDVVDDGDLVMAGGVTGAIDLAPWLVERELGSHIATAVAEELEYPRNAAIWQAAGDPR